MSRVLVVEDEAHLAAGCASISKPKAMLSRSSATANQRSIGCWRRTEALRCGCARCHAARQGRIQRGPELRAGREFVPVLMLTARGRPEDVLPGFASGADDYLAKPFELSILLARLQGLLRRARMDARTPQS